MTWTQLSSTVIIALLSSISGQVFMLISHLEPDLNKKTYIKKMMYLKKWALWAKAKKSHRDILTTESTKVNLYFGHTFKFLFACAKPGQAAKNGNFQNLFFELSTHNCRYSHETLCND
jgi:hypothetical protein